MEKIKPTQLNIENAIIIISDPENKDFSIGYFNQNMSLQVDEYTLDVDQVETLYRMVHQFLIVNRPGWR